MMSAAGLIKRTTLGKHAVFVLSGTGLAAQQREAEDGSRRRHAGASSATNLALADPVSALEQRGASAQTNRSTIER
jgi:hypothetical protein